MKKYLYYIKNSLSWLLRKRNLYIAAFLFFSTWILFCDNNSVLRHRQLNKEINHLKQQKRFLEEKIASDKKSLREFKTREGKIKFGREKYYFKKEDEDIFIIEYDTIEK